MNNSNKNYDFSYLSNLSYVLIFSMFFPFTIKHITKFVMGEIDNYKKLNEKKVFEIKDAPVVNVKEWLEECDIKCNYMGFKNAINHFVNTVVEKMPRENLKNFNNNINSLYIFKVDKKILNPAFLGCYSPVDNTIDSIDDESLYHEFIHMMSSTCCDDVYYSGFRQSSAPLFGRGIDEGYTQVLTERYFKDKISGSHYVLEFYFASMLEKIIGKEKMESLYFNCDLKGLIDELSVYSSEEEVKDFISNLDLWHECIYDNKCVTSAILKGVLTKKLREINLFVSRCYIAKLKENYFNGNMDSEEVDNAFKTYVDNCLVRYDIKGFKFRKLISETQLYELKDKIFFEEDVLGRKMSM